MDGEEPAESKTTCTNDQTFPFKRNMNGFFLLKTGVRN